jgi:hypothetical protein
MELSSRYIRYIASLSKHMKTEIISYILSDHNALKLELNNETTAENM